MVGARKLRARPGDRGVYVEVCLGCGCLVPRDGVGVLEVYWSEADPGRDEVGRGKRTTRGRACLRCRRQLEDSGGLVTRHGDVEVTLSRLKPIGKWMTRGDKVMIAEGVRRRCKV